MRCAPFIKEIGRGVKGARSLSIDQTHALYAAVLDGRVSDLELGAILLAYRIKGESADELDGMLRALHERLQPVAMPAGRAGVCIPTYNGARKLPNLVPLLAFLLAAEGVSVLLHGVRQDPGRVATAEVLGAMGVAPAESSAQAEGELAGRGVAFLPIDVLAPVMARQLALRATLGVRNSAHTLVKLMQAADPGTLRLVNYTHPPYRDTLTDYFGRAHAAPGAGVLLARGTEGEAVADANLVRETGWLRDGVATPLIVPDPAAPRVPAELPASREAEPTAAWIRRALAGEVPVPAPILRQRDAILSVLGG
ncbi:DNA-binding protein YbiB [Verticiella sediminum]